MEQIESRTKKSLRNAKFAIPFFCTNLILSFYSRKIFFSYLGTEILGLNSTVSSMALLLNLAELGIWIAVAYSLYAPLFKKDEQSINEIISIQAYLYRNIAIFIFIGSMILMAFFPLIFAKADLPMWTTFATFGVVIYGALMGYIFNYKQILIEVDQKAYKLTLIRNGTITIKVIAQIFAVKSLPDPYIWYLLLEFIGTTVTTILIHWIIKRDYPWLDTSPDKGRRLRKKYPELFVKTKQVFIHKIADVFSTQMTYVFIYSATSLTVASLYGNYWMIGQAMITLFAAIFNNMNAGIGNLVAEGDADRIKHVFWELHSIRFLLTSISCFMIVKVANPFISHWLGSEYMLDISSVVLISITIYILLMKEVTGFFINAYGLYSDVWAPIAQIILSMVLSVTLGQLYGLNGILLGMATGSAIILFFWKPYFLYKKGFKEPVWDYVWGYARMMLMMLIAFLVTNSAVSLFDINPYDSWPDLMVYAGLSGVIVLFISTLLLYLTVKPFRIFCGRFIHRAK